MTKSQKSEYISFIILAVIDFILVALGVYMITLTLWGIVVVALGFISGCLDCITVYSIMKEVKK